MIISYILISLAILLLAAIPLRFAWLSQQQKRRDAQAQSKKQHAAYGRFLRQHAEAINQATDRLFSPRKKYISFSEWQGYMAETKADLPLVKIPKDYLADMDLHKCYTGIKQVVRQPELQREKHNAIFLAQQKKSLKTYFDKLLSNPLDAQQVDAILHDEDNSLVIAGAGCGKTTSIVGKVQYILDQQLAQPHEILLLSFAKRHADELQEKLGHLGVRCQTFHALAYRLLKRAGYPGTVIQPDESEELLQAVQQALFQDGAFLASFNDLLLYGLRPIKSQHQFSSYKAYVQYLKEHDFQSIKDLLLQKNYRQNNSKATLKRNPVKSAEECYIANFLFLNEVAYSYEAPYRYPSASDTTGNPAQEKASYRPDFTIYLNGYDEQSIQDCPNPAAHVIYLEHYGIDEQGNTPPFFSASPGLSASDSYKRAMEWKAQLHERYGSTLIKTYSYEFANRSIEENLLRQLHAQGVRLSPKSNKAIYAILQEAYSKELQSVRQLISTFINLLKSSNRSFEALHALNNQRFKNDRELRQRNQQVLELMELAYKPYEKRLQKLGKVDFNDLINKSIGIIDKQTLQQPIKYIIVDEFQDISRNRFALLQALKQQQPYKLFAVGDDWQSIYRFSGSDLTLFTQFADYFGFSHMKKIETTYRFAEPLLGLSSRFILKNPNQTRKILRSAKAQQTMVVVDYSKESNKKINSNLLAIMQSLYASYGPAIAEKRITLLGRYHHDIKQIDGSLGFAMLPDHSAVWLKALLGETAAGQPVTAGRPGTFLFDRKIDFYTVHSAKGLESDIVILINCETGRYGFPAEYADEHVLDLLLSGTDRYPNSEERRTFYVALTRAKERLIFLANKDRQSQFLQEIYEDLTGSTHKTPRCPRCDAELRLLPSAVNKANVKPIWGCSNYRYGCRYTQVMPAKQVNDK